jgi:hypothetical protein
MKGKLISICVVEESSILAFSAASRTHPRDATGR